MSNPLTNLNLGVFSVGGNDLLALVRSTTISADNDLVDAAGLSNRYEYNLPVKQGQKIDFTVEQLNGSSIPDTNLDISVFSVGGTSYLASLRGGAINVTTKTKEGSAINAAYKNPVPVRTAVEFTCDLMVFTLANMTNLMITGTEATMEVTVLVTYGGESFNCPMVLKSSNFKIEREEIQMESVTFSGNGTPTGPSDSTLLGLILLGNALVAVSVTNTASGGGGKNYATSYALITRLNTKFADGALIDLEGTLEVQGALTLTSA